MASIRPAPWEGPDRSQLRTGDELLVEIWSEQTRSQFVAGSYTTSAPWPVTAAE